MHSSGRLSKGQKKILTDAVRDHGAYGYSYCCIFRCRLVETSGGHLDVGFTMRCCALESQVASQMEVEMNLQQLLEKARQLTMTEKERETQRQSFAYGNSHIENETITRETVRRASEKLKNQESAAK
jgi:hypothetical protein